MIGQRWCGLRCDLQVRGVPSSNAGRAGPAGIADGSPPPRRASGPELVQLTKPRMSDFLFAAVLLLSAP